MGAFQGSVPTEPEDVGQSRTGQSLDPANGAAAFTSPSRSIELHHHSSKSGAPTQFPTLEDGQGGPPKPLINPVVPNLRRYLEPPNLHNSVSKHLLTRLDP